MTRTIREVDIGGKTLPDVREVVRIWAEENGLKTLEEGPHYWKLRKGWLLSSPRIYEIAFTPQEWGVGVVAQGYIVPLGMGGETELGGEGALRMESLLRRLAAMSSGRTTPKPAPCPTCKASLEWVAMYKRWFCRGCGKYA